MKIIRGISALHSCSFENARSFAPAEDRRIPAGSVVTIGAFDGVHKGHQAVLAHVVETARQHSLCSVVLTLEPLPREYFAPLDAPARLMSIREKYCAMAALGIDYLMVVRFNEQVRRMTPSEFTKAVIVEGLRCKHLIIGDDFKFGRDGRGDLEMLETLAGECGFHVQPTSTISQAGERVSSTRIRELLANAQFDDAEALLGRPYSITGKVVYGKQLGRSLGVPTANIELHRLRSAMSGVYAVKACIDGESTWHCGVANVGTRPTVDDSIKAILEVHLLNYAGDLYGKRMEVQFCQKIRDEEKFSSLEVLRQQINQDIQQAKLWFTQHSMA